MTDPAHMAESVKIYIFIYRIWIQKEKKKTKLFVLHGIVFVKPLHENVLDSIIMDYYNIKCFTFTNPTPMIRYIYIPSGYQT